MRGPIESRGPAPTPDGAAGITRGVTRLLADLGYRALTEFPLGNGRRADVIGVDRNGVIAIVEVKTSAADFRGDGKWTQYVPFCDAFSFAVPPGFPRRLLPEGVGIIVADAHYAAVVRHAPVTRLVAARRRAVTLRFARSAAGRLGLLLDPHAGARRER